MVALALALLLKALLVQAFYIPSGSMERTLLINDRVLVNKVVYKFRDVHRGEIVVFNGFGSNWINESEVPPPKNWFDGMRRKVQGLLGLGTPGEKDFIKRVIGVPGDVVACCTDGHVTVNGKEVEEPYLYFDSPDRPQSPFGPDTVPEGHLWVMGDHRDGSSDARVKGPIPANKVVGRAFVIIWPPKRAKTLMVPDTWSPDQTALPATPWSLAVTPPVLGLVGALPVTALRRRIRCRRRRN